MVMLHSSFCWRVSFSSAFRMSSVSSAVGIVASMTRETRDVACCAITFSCLLETCCCCCCFVVLFADMASTRMDDFALEVACNAGGFRSRDKTND